MWYAALELIKCPPPSVYSTAREAETAASSLLTPAELQQQEHALQIAQEDGLLRRFESVIEMWLKGQALSAASVADARSAVLLCGWAMCCKLHKIGADQYTIELLDEIRGVTVRGVVPPRCLIVLLCVEVRLATRRAAGGKWMLSPQERLIRPPFTWPLGREH